MHLSLKAIDNQQNTTNKLMPEKKRWKYIHHAQWIPTFVVGSQIFPGTKKLNFNED